MTHFFIVYLFAKTIMKLDDILASTIPGLGYEFVAVEQRPNRLICIYIDKPTGVTIEDCEKVSDHLSRLFLVENIDYNRLEVSSPGVERPLRVLADYSRFMLQQIKVRTHAPIDGQKIFIGIIDKVDGDMITLKLEKGDLLTIDYANISRSHLVFDYKQVLKLNTKERKKK